MNGQEGMLVSCEMGINGAKGLVKGPGCQRMSLALVSTKQVVVEQDRDVHPSSIAL